MSGGEEVGALIGVMASMSRCMASHNPLTVRPATVRSSALSFEKAPSSCAFQRIDRIKVRRVGREEQQLRARHPRWRPVPPNRCSF